MVHFPFSRSDIIFLASSLFSIKDLEFFSIPVSESKSLLDTILLPLTLLNTASNTVLELSFFSSAFKSKNSVLENFCLFLSLSTNIFTQADCTLPAESVELTKFIFFCSVAQSTGETL